MLVFIEPDFGTALVYLASLVCVLFVAGVRLRHLALLGGIAAILAVAVLWALPAGGVEVLKPYQVDRLTSFLHPDRNTLAEGYNQSQAKIAVGSGGLVGRGKSGATQTLNDFLPERRTDFVFAVLGEERGFVGAMLLLGLYLVILWRVLRAVGRRAHALCPPDLRRRVRLAARVDLHQRGHDDRDRARHGHSAAAALGRRLEHDHGAGGDRRGAGDPAARAPAAAPAAGATARGAAGAPPRAARAGGR